MSGLTPPIVRGPLMVAAALIGSSACVPDTPLRAAVDRDARCAEVIEVELRSRGIDPTQAHIRPHPSGTMLVFETGTIGRWVTLAPAGEHTILEERGREGFRRTRFDEACLISSDQREPAPRADETLRFTDADLERALGREANGVVVYAWSPHMPLSVDGYAQLVAAARGLGMTVEPVLISPVDTAFARAEAERVAMPPAAIRVIDSVELTARELAVHAPALIAFYRGRVSPVLPGYRNTAGYTRFLTSFVEAR